MLKNCDFTNYPEFYRQTYWGQFRGRNENNYIYENRNKFIQDYNINIKSKINNNKIINEIYLNQELVKELDHIEVYKQKDTNKFIILSSNYNVNTHLKLIPRGWTNIYTLYGGTNSFIKILEPKKIKEQLKYFISD
jgi:hypothetical protein